MQQEMIRVRENHALFGVPIRSAPDNDIPREESALRMRLVREETDELLEALRTAQTVLIADGIADTMVVTAGSLVQLGLRPQYRTWARASEDLILEARNVFHTAVNTNDWDNALRGALMLEIVVRGVAATIGIPYEAVFKEVHANNMAKVGPDGKPIFDEGGKFMKPPGHPKPRIREILVEAGVLQEKDQAAESEGGHAD